MGFEQPGRRSRAWLRQLSVAIAASVLFSGCGGRQNVNVGAISPHGSDGRTFQVGAASCDNDLQVAVKESNTTVEIRATELRRGLFASSPACADIVTFTLQEPLDSRVVIDAGTGREVRVLEEGRN